MQQSPFLDPLTHIRNSQILDSLDRWIIISIEVVEIARVESFANKDGLSGCAFDEVKV